MPGTTTNESLLEWVDSWAKVLTPDSIHWCDGSQEEYDVLAASMVEQGTLIPLNEAKRPNSFWPDPTLVMSLALRTGHSFAAMILPMPETTTIGVNQKPCEPRC